MIDQAEVKSVLTLNKVYFEKIEFTCTGKEIPSNYEKYTKVGFQLLKPLIDINNLEIRVVCVVSIADVVNIELMLVGDFTITGSEDIEKFIPNAIAILFPYLRSQLSLITAQPNIPTLVLPPININKLIQQNKLPDKPKK